MILVQIMVKQCKGKIQFVLTLCLCAVFPCLKLKAHIPAKLEITLHSIQTFFLNINLLLQKMLINLFRLCPNLYAPELTTWEIPGWKSLQRGGEGSFGGNDHSKGKWEKPDSFLPSKTNSSFDGDDFKRRKKNKKKLWKKFEPSFCAFF